MNIARVIPGRSSPLDTPKVELSMNWHCMVSVPGRALCSAPPMPILYGNGWTEDGAQFMTDLCGEPVDCGIHGSLRLPVKRKKIPVSSEARQAHASVDTCTRIFIHARTHAALRKRLHAGEICKIPPCSPIWTPPFKCIRLWRQNGSERLIKFSFTRPASSVPCPESTNRRSTNVPMPCYIRDYLHEYRDDVR